MPLTAETPKTKPYYSRTVSWQTGACHSTSTPDRLIRIRIGSLLYVSGLFCMRNQDL